ncbi:RidA family protein [Amycolatopsis sp. cg13]|uniref:RidA family protein n=1 Tax=Amycolatopsis sp. cg13 TaxID=3238807 RepID=UPI003524FA8A
MAVKKVNTDTLAKPHGFAHAMVASGSKIITTTGQISADLDGNIVGAGDHATQSYLATVNAFKALTATGAAATDVTRMMVYVVDATQENLEKVYEGLGKGVGEAGGKSTAMTLVGIIGLANPDALIEIDLTAVVD